MSERLRTWLRHPTWAWTVRYPVVLAAGLTVGSLLAGVGVNAIGALVPGGLAPGQSSRQELLLGIGFGAAAIVYGVALAAYVGRKRMLARNGTAFVVRERARDWDRDATDDFDAQVRLRFARVINVPGPGQLGAAWDWPLDSGAPDWEARTGELVRSFRTLYVSESSEPEPAAARGIFVTAWWALALALGYRLSAGDRSLELDVWQRPSAGRNGKVTPSVWAQRGHRFDAEAAPVSSGLALLETVWDAGLTVERPGDVPVPGSAAGAPVSVLLIRFGRREWGPLPPAEGAEWRGKGPLALTLHDMGGVVPVTATVPAHIHELRCVPAPLFQWDDFPFLAATALAWIQGKARELDGHTLLLGTMMPNEIAFGIGLAAGRERTPGWPGHLLPVIHRKPAGTLIVPRLNLGASFAAGDASAAGPVVPAGTA